MPDGVADSASALAALAEENRKLRRINAALIAHAERGADPDHDGFSLFQTAAALGNQVQERTAALSTAMRELERVNTALLQAQANQARLQQRLADAIESMNQGILLCDAEDRVVVTNRRYREIWGDTPVAEGTPFRDLVRAAVERGIEGGAERGAAWAEVRLARHLHPGEPFLIQAWDGSWLQLSERRLPSGGTVSLYTDITEVKQREEQRREAELAEKSVLLQATLDNLAQGVAVFTARRDLVAYNGRFFDLLHGAAQASRGTGLSAASLKRLRALGLGFVAGDGDDDETELRTLSIGEADPRAIEVRRSVMPGGGYVSTYTDITERLRDAAALRHANESLEHRVAERTAELSRINREMTVAKAEAEQVNVSKTRFFAAANHDLLQPLAAARVFASALSERRLSSQNRELLRHALAALDNVDELLTALLDIARLDAGVLPPEPCTCLLPDILTRVGEEFRMIAHAKGLRLRLMPGTAVVRTDPRLLGRILRNFVSNAIRYTQTGGLLIGTLRHPDGVLLGVWDTGIGIAAGQQEEIFEEFRRLQQTSDRDDRGAGLGLAIVRRICRMLGHPVVVRSTPGRGSLFGIVLPLADAATLPASRPNLPPGRAAAGPNALRGRRVHLIDDEPHVLQAMGVLLSGWGMKVQQAASAAEALEQAREAPELIIADYRLAGSLTGLDAIATLRRRWGDVPAVIVTADYAPELQRAVAAAGHMLLHKPVRPARLRSLITHVLEVAEE